MKYANARALDIPEELLARYVAPRDAAELRRLRDGEYGFYRAPEFRRANAAAALAPGPNSKAPERCRWLHFCRAQAAAVAADARRWNMRTVADVMRWAGAARDERDAVVTANLGLVHAMARRFPNDFRDDAVGAGSIGLIRAAERFDWSRGFAFSSYACTSIIRTILREREIAARFPAQCVADVMAAAGAVEAKGYREADAADFVATVLPRLGGRDAGIIRARYGIGGDETAPKDIGARLNLTGAGVRGIIRRGLGRLADSAGG